jgi:predicted GNAT family acetyltransferase
LRRVNPPEPLVPGALRVATEADLPLMSEWVWGFIQDAGLEGTAEGAREIAEMRIADRDLFIWDDRGPVSTVTKTRHSTHGIVVSLVYTPPAHRNRGYASAAVAALSQQLLDAGWEFCALFTDLANPTSNSIYQKVGYQSVADFDEYIFG